jgi:hypothetical protein
VLIDTFEPPAEAFSVSASLDRVSIPMEEPAPERSEQKVERNFRMAFCGTVTLHDEDGKALYTIRYGRMPNGSAVELCDALANDVLELVAKKPSLAVMLLADGAHEMWNLLEAEFTVDRIKAKVNELVDFWHLVEKLTPAAKILCNFNEKEASSKMGRWRFELLNSSDGADKILAELKASGRDQGPNKECPVHAAITYLSNHKDRMDYASARAAGLPIGSGQVEASCKSLVSTRMKRPGSRWKETTGDHIIQLRSLSLSDRWQNAIRLGLSPLRVAVRLVA